MKIMIVDDEQIMLDAVAKILGNEAHLQLETARSGREAIETAEAFHPHLVMMDIKMPGCNGLETLAEIRRILPNVITIIISAYDNFIYAQESIRLDVFDYLLKPITKTRLMEVIAKVQNHLDKLLLIRQKETTLREQHQKLRPLIERELILSLQAGDKLGALEEEYQAMLEIEIKAGFFVALVYSDQLCQFETKIETNYQLAEKLTAFNEWLHYRFHCLIGPMQSNPLTIFVPVENSELQTADFRVARRVFGQRVLEYLTAELNFPKARIGIGAIRQGPAAQFSLSYQEALQALNQSGEGLLYYQSANHQTGNPLWEDTLELELHEIEEAVRFGHCHQVEALCHKLSVKYSGSLPPQQDRLLTYLLGLMLTAYRTCREASKEHPAYPPLKQLLRLVDHSNGLPNILTRVTATLINLAQIIKNKRANQVKTIIVKAKEMIDQLYDHSLSLETVANAVAVSPFYLSRLFREEMGIGFTEYLIRLRMKKSLTLLSQGLTVKECSLSVGYNDPNYFSRLFRKYYQLSPTEYRETSLPKKGVIADEHSGD
jgi:two-component system response regulator YesN